MHFLLPTSPFFKQSHSLVLLVNSVLHPCIEWTKCKKKKQKKTRLAKNLFKFACSQTDYILWVFVQQTIELLLCYLKSANLLKSFCINYILFISLVLISILIDLISCLLGHILHFLLLFYKCIFQFKALYIYMPIEIFSKMKLWAKTKGCVMLLENGCQIYFNPFAKNNSIP